METVPQNNAPHSRYSAVNGSKITAGLLVASPRVHALKHVMCLAKGKWQDCGVRFHFAVLLLLVVMSDATSTSGKPSDISCLLLLGTFTVPVSCAVFHYESVS